MIRKATQRDADQIAIVLKSGYHIDSLDEAKDAFFSEIKKSIHYLVNEENSRIVGLVSWFFHGLPKHELVELDRIVVLPEYQGKGISQELFTALIDDANKELSKNGQKLRKLFLLTHASNEKAHKFYEKLGMTHEATLKSHFYDGEDEWAYSKFF